MATFRPSGIDIALRQDLVEGASRSGTTLNVDPIITKDGHRVAMSDIGDICFGKINPGNNNEEIFSFTGITDNTTYYTLTGCTWGYNFYNGTGDVDANKKKAVAGNRVIITNDDHFLNEQYLKSDDFNPKDNSLTWGDGADTDKDLIANNGDANKPFLRYDTSEDKWVFSNNGVDTAVIGGSTASYSSGDGIDITAGVIALDIASGSKLEIISTELDLNADISDALDGTSGTPSSSNKYVTADDVTEAKTASKIARRDSNSDILVATTPTDGDAATSKTYVDTEIAAATVEVDKLVGTGAATATRDYWNFTIPYIISTNVPSGDFWTLTNVTIQTHTLNSIFFSSSAGDANHGLLTTDGISIINDTDGNIEFSSGKKVIVEFGLKMKTTGNEQHGFGLSDAVTNFYTYNSGSSDSANFSIDASGNLYAHTAEVSGNTHTETAITGITLTDWNTYRIEFDPGVDAKFYVNGTLKATVTTTLPATNDIKFGAGSSGDEDRICITAPNFSIEK